MSSSSSRAPTAASSTKTASRAQSVAAPRTPSASAASRAPSAAQSLYRSPSAARVPSASQAASRAPTSASRRPSSSLSLSGATASTYERAVLNATNPIAVTETEQITVNNVKGVYANKKQVDAWKGDLAVAAYPIHNDANPQVINKKTPKQTVVQVNAVKLLRPVGKPAGDIIIEQLPASRPTPAPIVHVVVSGKKTCPKQDIVHREAPPKPPCDIPEKHIKIPGKVLPPAPRKVIIETVPDEPEKPQNVVVERWLPYAERERKVVFKPAPPAPCLQVPKNLNIVWEKPEVEYVSEVRVLEPECANPEEYKKQYACELKKAADLPEFARAETEHGQWGADKKCYKLPNLVGDLDALNLIDMDAEGLSEYKSQVPAPLCRAASAVDVSCSAPASRAASAQCLASRLSSIAGSRAPSAAGCAAAAPATPAAFSRAPSAAAAFTPTFSAVYGSAAPALSYSVAPSYQSSRAQSVAASRPQSQAQ